MTEEHAEAAESTAPLVLIADDEEPIAEAISWVVEELGYTALIARNGREALELTHARRPALLITDWMMPILDGVSLIRALKKQAAQEGLPMIPTILTTAARRAPPVAAEADAFLPKPYAGGAVAPLFGCARTLKSRGCGHGQKTDRSLN